MSAILPRRAFLRGLATLPLVGGAIELLGNPYAVAMPVSEQLMFEYQQWLRWETIAAYRNPYDIHGSWPDDEAKRLEAHAAFVVAQHLHPDRDEVGRMFSEPRREAYQGRNAGRRSHAYLWHHGAPPASARAALVLSAVGCEWRGAYR